VSKATKRHREPCMNEICTV